MAPLRPALAALLAAVVVVVVVVATAATLPPMAAAQSIVTDQLVPVLESPHIALLGPFVAPAGGSHMGIQSVHLVPALVPKWAADYEHLMTIGQSVDLVDASNVPLGDKLFLHHVVTQNSKVADPICTQYWKAAQASYYDPVDDDDDGGGNGGDSANATRSATAAAAAAGGHSHHQRSASRAAASRAETNDTRNYPSFVGAYGNERPVLALPWPYAYDGIVDQVIWHVINRQAEPQWFYIKITSDIINEPDNTPEVAGHRPIPATPLYLDAAHCMDASEFAVPQDVWPNDRYTHTGIVQMPPGVGGTVVWAMAHLHAGGLYMYIRDDDTGKTLCHSRAVYPEGKTSDDLDATIGMTPCDVDPAADDAFVVRANANLSLAGTYSTRSAIADAMAVAVLFVAQEPYIRQPVHADVDPTWLVVAIVVALVVVVILGLTMWKIYAEDLTGKKK